ncbi:MAG TPA: hypothetical protein ENH94_09790 [Phycisphaerales bacterium]|nr:hypothetical protein [Phycisphaerales bacterium]
MKTNLMVMSAAVMFVFTVPVLAVPTFQVYSGGAIAGDFGPDQDTWLATSNPADIIVAGTFSSNTLSLTEVTLLLSVPDSTTGTISVTGLNGASNPSFLGMFTTIAGFEPAGANFNNHYPMQDNVSDFHLYDIGEFFPIQPVADYNAETGIILPPNPNLSGQLKEYQIEFDGFEQVHVDVFGLVTSQNGPNIRTA